VKRNGGGNGQAAMTMENVIGNYEGLGLSAANNLTANDIDDLGENVENSTLQIMFKGAVKKLYDIPVYIFQFRDIMSNEDGYNVNHPMTFADTTKFQSTKIVTVAEGNAVANKSMFNSLKFGFKGTQNQSTFQLNQGSVLIAEDVGLNNGNKIVSHANNIYDKNSKEYIQALAESKKRKKSMFQLEIFLGF
jgi:predicted ester cyclase